MTTTAPLNPPLPPPARSMYPAPLYPPPAYPPSAPAVPGIPTSDEAPAVAGRHTPRERIRLAALLVMTAALYLWHLGASGYANDFYASAVQAGTKSWKALFFGSFDSSNFITVDKPPASLWPMEVAGRIFGFNSWSMLVPQAVEGVLAVWLLYSTIRRWFGPTAGLLAGTLLALTPVAVLMFRFNNPDALMTLLIVLAAYCVTRAIEVASTRWLLVAGLALGFSFLAKGLQPFTVVPALAIGYLVAAPTTLRTRLLQLLAAGLAVVAGAGWWVAIVSLTPAADRPYVGGSGNNSALGLAFGYNGLSRITGSSGSGPGGGGGSGGGANFSGNAGIGRLFNSLNGGQIAWLLPAAVIAICSLVVLTRRAPRVDRTRAALIVWGGWLIVTAAVLSYASGIIHTYYTVELAPAIAALAAIGAVTMWRHRELLAARWGMAASVLVTGIWGDNLLHRATGWHPWVADLVLVAAFISAVALLIPGGGRRGRALAVTGIAAGLVAIAGGPAAYALNTASTPHTGSTPSAGPTVAGGAFGGPGGGRPGGGGAIGGGLPGGSLPGGGAQGGLARPGAAEGGDVNLPGGGFGGPPAGGGFAGPARAPAGTGTAGARSGGGAGAGGQTTANSALTALLKATTDKWAAATIGSQTAGPLELSSGKAVMSIGGFNGGDAAPTLAQFEKYVAAGQVHYFIAGGGGAGGGVGVGGGAGGGPGRGDSNAITSWVAAHYTATTVGGATVYDLTKATT